MNVKMNLNLKKEKACGCIVIEDNKVLLIKQTDGNWGFPKGHVEEKESELVTALREVKEETNLDVEIDESKRYVMKYIIGDEIDKEVVLFVAKKIGGDIKPQEEEIIDIRWLTFDEAIKTLTFDNTKEILKKVLEDNVKLQK